MMVADPIFSRVYVHEEPFPMTSLSYEDVSYPRRVSSASERDDKTRCKALLPEDFQPTPYSVICGRGRMCKTSIGNRRLEVIASMFVGRYSELSRKEDKTKIVSQILRMVKQACPKEQYAFVKYCDGRWWEVETLIAREKIGAVLRDCLHSKYRSSTKSKLERRKAKKLHEEREIREDSDRGDVRPSIYNVRGQPSMVAENPKNRLDCSIHTNNSSEKAYDEYFY
jgi:hypothetical protein